MYIFNLTVTPVLESLALEDEDVKLKIKNSLHDITIQMAYDEYSDTLSLLSVEDGLIIPRGTSNILLEYPENIITEL